MPRSSRADRFAAGPRIAACAVAALLVSGCDSVRAVPIDGGPEVENSYAAVEAILARSCAYERCHAGALIGAGLDLSRGTDYRAALVSVTACEYDGMARVEPGDPDHSWLMVKLTAPFRAADDPYAQYIEFTPEPGWDPARRGCADQTDDGVPLFGQRMPLTAPNMLAPAELSVIRAWIGAGAPP